MSFYGIEKLRVPPRGSAESNPCCEIVKCPNCGKRYTTKIIKCEYCGLGPNVKQPIFIEIPVPQTRKVK